MQDVMVSNPPQATSWRPFSTTERVWYFLPWEENERMRRMRGLPGAGKGGIVQLAAGNVSMFVLLLDDSDPVMMSPAQNTNNNATFSLN